MWVKWFKKKKCTLWKKVDEMSELHPLKGNIILVDWRLIKYILLMRRLSLSESHFVSFYHVHSMVFWPFSWFGPFLYQTRSHSWVWILYSAQMRTYLNKNFEVKRKIFEFSRGKLWSVSSLGNKGWRLKMKGAKQGKEEGRKQEGFGSKERERGRCVVGV